MKRSHIRPVSLLLALTFVISAVFCFPSGAADINSRIFEQRYAVLYNTLINDGDTLNRAAMTGKYLVFLSVSDGKKAARVAMSASMNVFDAMTAVKLKAKSYGVFPKWMKLDIMTSLEKVPYEQLKGQLQTGRGGALRDGIAFNAYLGTAVLEAQLNSDGIIDYETGRIDLDRLNVTLRAMGKKKLSVVPSEVYTFRTQGYFCDNGSYSYKLTDGRANDYGKRAADADRDTIEYIAGRVGSYFSSISAPDGKFVYGYYPVDGEQMQDYNITRHAGACWDLSMLYEMSRDESLVPVIENSLRYLSANIKYRNKYTAYIVNNGALSLGSSGLALLAYCAYRDISGSTDYDKTIEALANGILCMQKPDGGFVHELSKKDYTVSKDYIIVFYDGEAMYGMIKAYEATGKEKFLRCARKAADFFIASGYETLNSHWIEYGFNELTKHIPDEKYFEFGLKNLSENEFDKRAGNIKSAGHTTQESLLAGFELYTRAAERGLACAQEYDIDVLLNSINFRAQYGLNYFMFPEYAMYFKKPETVADSFAVREDRFRIRIDDIQHFMDGYYLYWKNYDKLCQTAGEETAQTA